MLLLIQNNKQPDRYKRSYKSWVNQTPWVEYRFRVRKKSKLPLSWKYFLTYRRWQGGRMYPDTVWSMSRRKSKMARLWRIELDKDDTDRQRPPTIECSNRWSKSIGQCQARTWHVSGAIHLAKTSVHKRYIGYVANKAWRATYKSGSHFAIDRKSIAARIGASECNFGRLISGAKWFGATNLTSSWLIGATESMFAALQTKRTVHSISSLDYKVKVVKSACGAALQPLVQAPFCSRMVGSTLPHTLRSSAPHCRSSLKINLVIKTPIITSCKTMRLVTKRTRPWNGSKDNEFVFFLGRQRLQTWI